MLHVELDDFIRLRSPQIVRLSESLCHLCGLLPPFPPRLYVRAVEHVVFLDDSADCRRARNFLFRHFPCEDYADFLRRPGRVVLPDFPDFRDEAHAVFRLPLIPGAAAF